MSFRLRSSGRSDLGSTTFIARPHFSPGLLPSKQEVIEVLLFRLKGSGRNRRDELIVAVAGELMEHWTFQNIYTIAKVAKVGPVGADKT